MSAPIVVGYDPHGADDAPVHFGVAAARFTGAPLIVAAVYGGHVARNRLADDEFREELSADARAALDRVRTRLEGEARIQAEVRLVEARSAARGLHVALEDEGAGLAVVGSTSGGAVEHAVIGSTAERVIHGATCPVVVTPSGFRVPEGRMGVIGAAFAPTPEGRNALRVAAALATSAGARLRAIMALDPRLAEHQSPGMLAKDHHEHRGSEDDAAAALIAAERALDEAIAEVPEGVETERDVLFLDPADGLTAASEQLDLLVMGSRGYGPLRAVMLGGVTRRMISRAACPLLILPRGLPGGLDAFKLSREATPPVGG